MYSVADSPTAVSFATTGSASASASNVKRNRTPVPEEERCCEPSCKKKANVLCPYYMCRGCCWELHKSVDCITHTSSQRRQQRATGGGDDDGDSDDDGSSASSSRAAASGGGGSQATRGGGSGGGGSGGSGSGGGGAGQQMQHALAPGAGLQQQRMALRPPAKRARYLQLPREAPPTVAFLEATTGRASLQGSTLKKSKNSKGLFAPHHLKLRDHVSEALVNGYQLPSAFEVLLGHSYEEEEEERQRQRQEAGGGKQSMGGALPVPYYTRECVYCQELVSVVGGDFWVHLGQCNPNALLDVAAGRPDPELLKSISSVVDTFTPLYTAQRAAIDRYATNCRLFADALLDQSTVDQSVHRSTVEQSHQSDDQQSHQSDDQQSNDQSRVVDDDQQAEPQLAQTYQSILTRLRSIEEQLDATPLPLDPEALRAKRAAYDGHLSQLYQCTSQAAIQRCLEQFRADFPHTPTLALRPVVQPVIPAPQPSDTPKTFLLR